MNRTLALAALVLVMGLGCSRKAHVVWQQHWRNGDMIRNRSWQGEFKCEVQLR